MTRIATQLAQNGMAVLLALALALVGFGHRMNLAEPVDLAAYAMPDGTMPELCLDAAQDDHNRASRATCPACIIAASMQVPPVVGLPAFELTVVEVEWTAPAYPPFRAHPARAPPARGPPPVFLI